MWIWNYCRDLTEVSGGVDAAGEPVNGRPSIPDEATYDRTWY